MYTGVRCERALDSKRLGPLLLLDTCALLRQQAPLLIHQPRLELLVPHLELGPELLNKHSTHRRHIVNYISYHLTGVRCII